jgi:hypothetical protein
MFRNGARVCSCVVCPTPSPINSTCTAASGESERAALLQNISDAVKAVQAQFAVKNELASLAHPRSEHQQLCIECTHGLTHVSICMQGNGALYAA